jgi:hypothetical protein
MLRIFAVLGGGALAASALAAAPAMATTAAHAGAADSDYGVVQVNATTWTNVLSKTLSKEPLAGSWVIRTRSCNSVCYEVTSEGLGFLMTIQSTGFSTFNKSTGNNGTIYTTPNGYCAHGTSGSEVIASTNCGATNTASQWVENSNGELINASYGGYMGEAGLGNNYNVLIEPTTGAYYDTPVDIG